METSRNYAFKLWIIGYILLELNSYVTYYQRGMGPIFLAEEDEYIFIWNNRIYPMSYFWGALSISLATTIVITVIIGYKIYDKKRQTKRENLPFVIWMLGFYYTWGLVENLSYYLVTSEEIYEIISGYVISLICYIIWLGIGFLKFYQPR